jgi:predicted SAM-dependent methyltransferase
VDELHCSHFLEHIPHSVPNEPLFYGFFNECWRILKDGGNLTVISPYYTSQRAYQDPGHTRYIADRTFLYVNQDWLKANKLTHYPVSCNFNFQINYSLSNPQYAGRNPEYVSHGMQYYWNIVDDLMVALTKIPMPKVESGA